jgi:flagellar motor switch protein FliG
MTRRSEIHREVLRLTEELGAARDRIKQAQLRTRVTGLKLPSQDYASMWERVYGLEKAVETARLELATVEETEAEKLVAIIRAEYPKTFAAVSSRLAGAE